MDTTFELYPLFGIYWVESPILLIFKMKTSNVDNPMYNFPMMISTNKKNSYRKLIREWSQGVSPKKKTTSPFKNSTKRSQPTNQAEIHKKSSCWPGVPFTNSSIFSQNGSNGSPWKYHLMGPLGTAPWNRYHTWPEPTQQSESTSGHEPRGLRRIGKNHPTEMGWWGEASLLVAFSFFLLNSNLKIGSFLVCRDEHTKNMYKQMVFFFMMNSLTNEWKHIHPKTGSKKKATRNCPLNPLNWPFLVSFKTKGLSSTDRTPCNEHHQWGKKSSKSKIVKKPSPVHLRKPREKKTCLFLFVCQVCFGFGGNSLRRYSFWGTWS